MNFKNQRVLHELEEVREQGYLLHGTWQPCKKLLPHCHRDISYIFGHSGSGWNYSDYRYQEKVVYGTWDIVEGVFYAIFGPPEKRNAWAYAGTKTKHGSRGHVTYWGSLQMRSGYILVLPSDTFSLARDQSAKMVSKVPVRVIKKIAVSPSIVRSWEAEGLLRIKPYEP